MVVKNSYIGYSREDRDLLVELRTSVAALRQDIYTIKDNISASVIDHETRLRSIELSITSVKTERESSEKFTRLAGAILVFIVGIAQFTISRIWK